MGHANGHPHRAQRASRLAMRTPLNRTEFLKNILAPSAAGFRLRRLALPLRQAFRLCPGALGTRPGIGLRPNVCRRPCCLGAHRYVAGRSERRELPGVAALHALDSSTVYRQTTYGYSDRTPRLLLPGSPAGAQSPGLSNECEGPRRRRHCGFAPDTYSIFSDSFGTLDSFAGVRPVCYCASEFR